MKEKSLHSGINLNKLKISYEKFKKTPFPKQPVDDALYDLYSDLVEFDAYIAGLISSLINGKKINQKDLYVDEKIRKCLMDIDSNNKQTQIAIASYINYINKINDLINLALKIM